MAQQNNEHKTELGSTGAEASVAVASMKKQEALPVVLLYAIALGLPLLWLSFSPFSAMVSVWFKNSKNAHGPIVLFLACYFIWSRRDELAELPAKPNWAGIALVAIGVVTAVITSISYSLFRSNASTIIIVMGMVLAIAGWQRFKLVALPLFYLFFMLPIPFHHRTKLAVPLQQMAAQAGTALLRLCGVATLHQGYVIDLPGRRLVVGEACSGINLLMGFLALGFVVAYLSKRKYWFKIILFAATIPIAVLVNVVRVAATGLIHHYLNPKLAEGFLHFFEGYVLFIAGVAFFFIVYKMLMFLARQLEVEV